MNQRAIRIMALLEAGTLTGLAKNLFAFFKADPIAVQPCLVTFDRTRSQIDRADPQKAANRLIEAANRAGVEVRVLNERFRFDYRVMSQLRDAVNRWQPDIIQTHGVKSHFLMRLSTIWYDTPWIAFHHGYTTPDLRMRAYNQLDRWSLPAADMVITVNNSFAAGLAMKGVKPERVRVVHNSISSSWLFESDGYASTEPSDLRERLGITPGERVILTIGRLSSEKGQRDLIDAFAMLRKARPESAMRLVIVGEGPERKRLERAASALSLSESVVLAGSVSDVRPFYRIADLFVLPSLSEGSPNVLLEAMAAGTPIVATKVGGVPEIVTHLGGALLVPPREPRSLAAAIDLLMSDDLLAQRITRTAAESVRANHSIAARARRLISLYRELLNTETFSEADPTQQEFAARAVSRGVS